MSTGILPRDAAGRGWVGDRAVVQGPLPSNIPLMTDSFSRAAPHIWFRDNIFSDGYRD